MIDNEPILTLIKDPLSEWGLTVEQLITSYYDCLKIPNLNFLGYKTNLTEFKDHTPNQCELYNSKYINFYSEINNKTIANKNFSIDLSNSCFTHDLILNFLPNLVLKKFMNNLSKVLKIHEDNIKLTFIETNITLLAHRDNAYFQKTKNVHPAMNTVKDAMITDSALNWNLLGKESKFRIIDKHTKYSNYGLGELSFFNPCKYKHGTTSDVHRLTLTARFFNLSYDQVWKSIKDNLDIIEINPCK